MTHQTRLPDEPAGGRLTVEHVITGFVHELRNVLTVAEASLERAQRIPSDDRPCSELSRAARSIGRARRLAQQMLSLSQPRAASQPVELEETVRNLAPTVAQIIGPKVDEKFGLADLTLKAAPATERRTGQTRQSHTRLRCVEGSDLHNPCEAGAKTSSLEASAPSKAKRRDKSVISGTNIYELLVQSVADYAIFILDAEGRVASWNLGAQQIKGYSAEEIAREAGITSTGIRVRLLRIRNMLREQTAAAA